MPRQPILSVLGHVDAGKTSILDMIRESRIVEGEEGGITQMIGATEVPLETVEQVCGGLLQTLDTELTIPGLLFIDTPGHAAFSSLRKRGGSISDIAILVIDINEGLQPQTKEAIDILKDSNTPFIIALNKVDTIPGWKSEDELFSKNLNKQSEKKKQEVNQKIYEIMGEMHDYAEISADRFDRVDNFQKKIAIVPVSAETGEGMPELLMVVTGLAQNYLQDQLEVQEGMGKGTILEVSQEKGLGTTLDIIHYDGTIKKDNLLVYGDKEGNTQTTKIRALLKPRPLKEIRLDKQFNKVEEVQPASGIKITGKNIENVVAGAPVRVANKEQLEEAKEEIQNEIEKLEIKTENEGIVIKADSLGSLEALSREIPEEIPIQKAEVGEIKKSDVIETDNEDPEYRSIFAFNVDTTDQAKQLIEEKNIKVFQEQVIYKIIEQYQDWKKELEEKQQKQALNQITRPAKIRLMPEHVFNKSKPVVAGSKVENGVLTPGSRLMNLEGEKIGRVKSVQDQQDTLEKAEKGLEVAVSITDATLGRDIEDNETLITDITGKELEQLRHLEEHLSAGEKQVLEEIIEIKDSIDPHWKI